GAAMRKLTWEGAPLNKVAAKFAKVLSALPGTDLHTNSFAQSTVWSGTKPRGCSWFRLSKSRSTSPDVTEAALLIAVSSSFRLARALTLTGKVDGQNCDHFLVAELLAPSLPIVFGP